MNNYFDSNDIDTIVKGKEEQKLYFQYPLNAAYDVLERSTHEETPLELARSGFEENLLMSQSQKEASKIILGLWI